MNARTRQPGAFTLIEIMMVVAILGLTVTMGIPSFVHILRREGMGKVERGLMEACQAARRSAILGNKAVYLVIRPHDHTFGVPGAFDTIHIPDNINIDIMGVNFISMELEEEARVRFNPNGTSDEFTIVFHGPEGVLRRLDLDISTGLPRVKDAR